MIKRNGESQETRKGGREKAGKGGKVDRCRRYNQGTMEKG